MKHKKLYISGMTCINCQKKIESALKDISEITEISVSYETGVAEFYYDEEKISMNQIRKQIENLGYAISEEAFSRKEVLIQTTRELAVIVILFWLLQHFGILNYFAPNSLADTGMGYGVLFVIGLITSVHCIAMCGGINLSQTLSKDISGKIERTMFRNTLAYNLGRVASYTIIGGILGAVGGLAGIGDSLQSSASFQGILKLFAGIFMVIMGVNMLGIFPGLRKLHLHLPIFRRKSVRKSRTPFVIGICNGFMPCGPLQSMQIVALASGNAVAGAFSMFCFSMGTVPLMLGFGSAIAVLGKHFTRQVMKVGAILVVVMGLSMMSQGGALVGSGNGVSDISAIAKNESMKEKTTDDISETDGVQTVSSILQSGSYPDITVKAGEPVKWTIEAPEGSINGCNYKIIQQDFGIEHVFEEGENVIEFTPTEADTYMYTCWMGMITGKIYVES